ncbi:MAG: urea ABC transporter permease subunit UrtB [Gammaproteobacteria bacterium]
MRLITRQAFLALLTLLALAASPGWAASVDTGDTELDAIFESMLSSNFEQSQAGIDKLAASDHPKAKAFVEGVLNGDLYIHKKSKRLVWAEKAGRQYILTDALNGEAMGEEKKRKLKRFPLNNSLRNYIASVLAGMDLISADPAARLAAVEAIIEKPTPAAIEALSKKLPEEEDAAVRAAMETAIALGQLSAEDADARLAAIPGFSDNLEPSVRARLNALAADDPDERVRAAATKALAEIEKQVEFYSLLETIFFGVSLGSVLVLAAIGLAITFGVMGVINMAHGELIMLGAYTTFLIQQLLPGQAGLAVALSIPAAFMVSGLVGIGIEKGIIRFLYGRPLETLLATFGVSLILQQLVRTVISPQNVPVENPEFMSGFYQVNSVLSLTYNRLYIIAFCFLVFAALLFILKRTNLGLQVRAVSQNRKMAQAMGVRSARVDAMTFGLGSGIAGVAGVALSQLTNVGPNLGQAYIVDSFMVVVFGGVGNLWGTLISGLTLGVANKFLEPWSGAVLAKILVLVFIILFIQKRPRGLFPQKGRAAEA